MEKIDTEIAAGRMIRFVLDTNIIVSALLPPLGPSVKSSVVPGSVSRFVLIGSVHSQTAINRRRLESQPQRRSKGKSFIRNSAVSEAASRAAVPGSGKDTTCKESRLETYRPAWLSPGITTRVKPSAGNWP